MDEIVLTFNVDINVSLLEGDIVFYQNATTEKVYQIGAVASKTETTLTCEIAPATPRPSAGDFIFFAKDAEVNVSGLVGYYASIKMELSGAAKKELFAVSTEVIQSS